MEGHLRDRWRQGADHDSHEGVIHVRLQDDPAAAHRTVLEAAAGPGTASTTQTAGATEDDHRVLNRLVSDRGFSAKRGCDGVPLQGFAARRDEGHGLFETHRGDEISPDRVAAHRRRLSDHLREPGAYQGAWVIRSRNTISLDAVKRFDDEVECRRFALDNRQVLYLDLCAVQEYYLHTKQDPLSVKDFQAWRQKYDRIHATYGEEMPEEYRRYGHIHWADLDVREFWAARGHQIVMLPPWLRGKALGGFRNHPNTRAADMAAEESWESQFRSEVQMVEWRRERDERIRRNEEIRQQRLEMIAQDDRGPIGGRR